MKDHLCLVTKCMIAIRLNLYYLHEFGWSSLAIEKILSACMQLISEYLFNLKYYEGKLADIYYTIIGNIKNVP